MKIIKLSANELNTFFFQNCVATIGIFDGLHKYHRKILTIAKHEAIKSKKPLVVITFDQKITSYLQSKQDAILTLKDKNNYLQQLFQPDLIIELIVDKQLVKTSKTDFIAWLKNNVKVNQIIEGDDFRFGFQGQGTITDLQASFGKENVIMIKRILTISSSKIKTMLTNGKIKQANKYLSHNFKMTLSYNEKENVFTTIFPNIKILPGTYEMMINDSLSAVGIINELNQISFSNPLFNLFDVIFIRLVKLVENIRP